MNRCTAIVCFWSCRDYEDSFQDLQEQWHSRVWLEARRWYTVVTCVDCPKAIPGSILLDPRGSGRCVLAGREKRREGLKGGGVHGLIVKPVTIHINARSGQALWGRDASSG